MAGYAVVRTPDFVDASAGFAAAGVWANSKPGSMLAIDTARTKNCSLEAPSALDRNFELTIERDARRG